MKKLLITLALCTTITLFGCNEQVDEKDTMGIDESQKEESASKVDRKQDKEKQPDELETKRVEENQMQIDYKDPYNILVLANKEHPLPADFLPEDLVVPDVRFPFTEDHPKKQLRKEAAHALEKLFSASDEAGLELFAQSGFRSFERQEAIFASNVSKHGEEHANTYSAKAGESEHQTGLVMDVTCPAVQYDLVTEFGETKEGKWLKENAHTYGFIIRYPEGKEHITQYQYEPWHLRYVGEQAASEIVQHDLTLEEFLGVK